MIIDNRQQHSQIFHRAKCKIPTFITSQSYYKHRPILLFRWHIVKKLQ